MFLSKNDKNHKETSSGIKLENAILNSGVLPHCDSKLEELPEKFKEILLNKERNERNADLPYIVGYKGFRRGVKSGNYYGKNFADTSVSAKIDSLSKK